MKTLLRLILLTTSFSLFALEKNQLAWECVSYAPSSEWVASVELPEESIPSEYMHKGAILLLDHQHNHVTKESFFHQALPLNSSDSVLYDSIIELEFDPNYEELVIHDIFVHRDGEILDKRNSCQTKITIREPMAENLVYQDVQVLTLFLDDVRRGDILEFSYTRKGYPPEFEDVLSMNFFVGSAQYVGQNFARLIAETGEVIEVKNHQTSLEPEIREIEGGNSEWIWNIEKVEPTYAESGLPSWFIPYPWIQVSNMQNWKNIASMHSSLFVCPSELDDELIELVEQWTQEQPLEDVIACAVRWVQGEVRYLSLHGGDDTFKPLHPNEVFQRRYGDCKDKTLLLTCMLRQMGVDAYPVLISTEYKHQLATFLPSIFFDHVIVGFEFEGREYFVDPTSYEQGGKLECFDSPPFAVGLALKDETEQLSTIPVSPERYKIEQKLNFNINISENVADIEYNKIYSGQAANFMRSYLGDVTLDGWLEEEESYFFDYFSREELVDGPYAQDHFDKNELSIQLKGFVNEVCFEDEGAKYYYIRPSFLDCFLPSYLNKQRQMPFRLRFPVDVQERVTINFDRILDKGLIEETSYSYRGKSLAFQMERMITGDNQLMINTHYQSFEDAIDAEDIGEVMRSLEQFEEELINTIPFYP